MKLHLHLFAIILAGFMSFAHAEPDQGTGSKPNLGMFADPIAQFAAPGEEAVGDLLLQAMSLMGVAYRFGGSSPETGLDCSGFIQYIFRKSLRVNLPRTSAEMARAGRVIDRSELAPGDLVFFNTRGFQYSHVGMYMGGNKFIHAPRTGKSVEVVNMSASYWAQRFNGARRINRHGVPDWKEPAAKAVVAKSAAPDSGDSKPLTRAERRKQQAEALLAKRQEAADARQPAGRDKKARSADAEPAPPQRKGRRAKTEAALVSETPSRKEKSARGKSRAAADERAASKDKPARASSRKARQQDVPEKKYRVSSKKEADKTPVKKPVKKSDTAAHKKKSHG